MQASHPAVRPCPVHDWFLERLPEIRSRARACFARLPSHEREEALADALAGIFACCVRAARRGRLDRLTPFHLVTNAARMYRSGRRTAGTSCTDVTADATRLRGRCTLVSLDTPPSGGPRRRWGGDGGGGGCGGGGGGDRDRHALADVLSDRREQAPLERVRQSLDYPQILERERVGPKARRVFDLLSSVRGDGSVKRIAAELGVSAGRVCQIKTKLAAALERHGYGPAEASLGSA